MVEEIAGDKSGGHGSQEDKVEWRVVWHPVRQTHALYRFPSDIGGSSPHVYMESVRR